MPKDFRLTKTSAFLKYVYFSLLVILSFCIILMPGCTVSTANISSPPKKFNKANDLKQSCPIFHSVKNLTGKIPENISVKGFGTEMDKSNPCNNGPGYLFNNIVEKLDEYNENIASGKNSTTDKNPEQDIKDSAANTSQGESSSTESVAAINIHSALAAMINATRNDNGAPSLVINASLNNVAQQRSDDMASRNYFSHTTPEGKNIYNFLAENGIMYSTAGENIQFCSPPSMASPGLFFNTWMDSDMHRANMLNPNFTGVGIGTSSNGESYYIVLVFTG